MKILMISYINSEKEGRFLRACNGLSKNHELLIVETDDTTSKKSIYLKMKTPLLRYFEFIFKVLKRVKNEEFDIIYANNYFSALPAIIIKKNKNKKLIYDAYELYYPASKKVFSKRDWFFYYFEKKAIKYADQVICANIERSLIMLGHYNLKKIPTVIENISSNSEYNATDIEKKESSVKIVYAGFLASDRNIMELLEAIRISKYKSKIVLDIYGYGPLGEEIKKLEKTEEFNFLRFNGSYKQRELNKILSQYDIGYVSYPNDDFNNIFCCPNKIYDYAVNDIVILASYNYNLNKIINKYKIGSCSEDLEKAILDVVENKKTYKQNISAFLKDNNWSNEEKKLLNVIEKINEIQKGK